MRHLKLKDVPPTVPSPPGDPHLRPQRAGHEMLAPPSGVFAVRTAAGAGHNRDDSKEATWSSDSWLGDVGCRGCLW